MNIAFATLYDTRDIRRGSGTFYYMSREIERQGHQVNYIGPIEFKYPLISRALRFIHRKIGKQYLTFLDPFVGKHTGQEVTQKLLMADYDVFITNDFAIAAYTKTDKPILVYTDVMKPSSFKTWKPFSDYSYAFPIDDQERSPKGSFLRLPSAVGC
jgi:hypothetical protein